MRAAAFETIVPDRPITSLPLSLEQSASRTSPLLIVVLALPAAMAALTPFFLIAHQASRDATLFYERQETTALLALALVMWGVLFGWPIASRAGRMGLKREIDIGGGVVAVTEQSWWRRSEWREPLSAYHGIAHHIRASLSGTRHELILIHADPARCLLLRTANRIGQSEIDQLTQLLGCREIAPQVFYRNRSRWPAAARAEPGRTFAAAG